MLGALSYGTPQLVLPKGADQFWNADAMARAELAAVLEPDDVTPEAVACVAAAELGETSGLRLDAVRAEIAAMPDPAEVLDRCSSRQADDLAGVVEVDDGRRRGGRSGRASCASRRRSGRRSRRRPTPAPHGR